MKKIVIEMMTVDDIDNVVEVENNCFSIPWSKESFLKDVNDYLDKLAAGEIILS